MSEIQDLRTWKTLFELLMNKTKLGIVTFSKLKEQNVRKGKGMQYVQIYGFRERMSGLSLGFRSIGLLVFDGARRKVVLRGEGYVWTPIWRSSDNSKR